MCDYNDCFLTVLHSLNVLKDTYINLNLQFLPFLYLLLLCIYIEFQKKRYAVYISNYFIVHVKKTRIPLSEIENKVYKTQFIDKLRISDNGADIDQSSITIYKGSIYKKNTSAEDSENLHLNPL